MLQVVVGLAQKGCKCIPISYAIPAVFALISLGGRNDHGHDRGSGRFQGQISFLLPQKSEHKKVKWLIVYLCFIRFNEHNQQFTTRAFRKNLRS